jgi:hypothetical protein
LNPSASSDFDLEFGQGGTMAAAILRIVPLALMALVLLACRVDERRLAEHLERGELASAPPQRGWTPEIRAWAPSGSILPWPSEPTTS